MKFPWTDIFEYYFSFYLLWSQVTNFDRIYQIYLMCAMENIRSQDVGVSSFVEKTPKSPHFEDKNPSANWKTIRGHRKGNGDLGNPANTLVTRSVRRSTKLNSRVNPVSFSPCSNIEQEWPSTAVVNDGSDETMVYGPNYSIKKNSGGILRRGMGKGNGNIRAQGKIKG